jgi:hypothetical protein
LNKDDIRNVAASVRQRLLNIARDRGEEFQLILSDFAIERLLYRLSISPYDDRFILKGANLLQLWWGERHRATWDLDLLGRVENSIDLLQGIFQEICAIQYTDGLHLDPLAITGEEIRSTDEYSGVRLHLQAELAGARIPVQVDIGFGDMVTPPPVELDYPKLLDFPAARILTYPREAMVAEKFEAIVTLGVTNSRMKDVYDIYAITVRFGFEGSVLTGALRDTFQKRHTPLPVSAPVVLSEEFVIAPEHQIQWSAFLRRSRLDDAPEYVKDVIPKLQEFLMPPAIAVAEDTSFDLIWHPGGPWHQHK